MKRETRQLVERIKKHEEALEGLRVALSRIQEDCDHDWLGSVFDPIIQPAHDVPEWKQGSDYRPGCHVPEKKIPRWHRTCTICGLVQTTDKSVTHTQTTLVPNFPGS